MDGVGGKQGGGATAGRVGGRRYLRGSVSAASGSMERFRSTSLMHRRIRGLG
jgi:hypothetical protein